VTARGTWAHSSHQAERTHVRRRPTRTRKNFEVCSDFAACFPKAVRVALGKWAMVLFLLASAAAFFTLRRAAAFCLEEVIQIIRSSCFSVI
jgi:hypothetical protein